MMTKSPTNAIKALLSRELHEEAAHVAQSNGREGPTQERILLQLQTDFAESIVWNLQRQYFEQVGIKAWQDGVVPHYITSSSYMADAYAQIVFAWLLDQRDAGHERLRILELGAGSGQFTFHFLKHLNQLWTEQFPETPRLPIQYVMSDLSQENNSYWQNHSRLQAWYEEGILDAACFDVEKDTQLTTLHSRETWQSADQLGPVLVIANYLFDSIRQDYWCLQNGEISKLYVTTRQQQADRMDLSGLQFEYSVGPRVIAPYQGKLLFNLVNFYRKNLPEGLVSVPNYGISCLEQIKAWCGNQVTLICGDTGVTDWMRFSKVQYPTVATHGSISTIVNFHALQWYAEHQKGQSWICGAPTNGFKVCAVTWEQQLNKFGRTCEKMAVDFSPTDQFTLKKIIELHCDSLSVTEVISYLRFSGYDPKALWRMLPRLMELASQLSAVARETLLEIIWQTWDNYYPLGEKEDLAFMIGCFLYEVDDYANALWFFNQSVATYGPDSGTMANIAHCHQMLSDAGA